MERPVAGEGGAVECHSLQGRETQPEERELHIHEDQAAQPVAADAGGRAPAAAAAGGCVGTFGAVAVVGVSVRVLVGHPDPLFQELLHPHRREPAGW